MEEECFAVTALDFSSFFAEQRSPGHFEESGIVETDMQLKIWLKKQLNVDVVTNIWETRKKQRSYEKIASFFFFSDDCRNIAFCRSSRWCHFLEQIS